MFKQFFRKGVNLVDVKNRSLGRIPAPVARALVGANHATVLHNYPAVIGLKNMDSKTVSPNRVVSTSPLKNLLHTASLFASKGSRMPVLNSILFKVVDDTLCVMATDLESHFIGYLEHGANCSFTNDEGINAVCVNARHFGKILASQNDNLNLHIMKGQDNPALRIGEFLAEGEDASGFQSCLPAMLRW